MRIARRFNAGTNSTLPKVPQGRLNPTHRLHYFSRPCGTQNLRTPFPALKRRAIFGGPFGTTMRGGNREFLKSIKLEPGRGGGRDALGFVNCRNPFELR